MNTDKDLNCIDLVRAVTRISRLCSIRATKDCKNCIFRDNSEYDYCAINYPTEWNTRKLYKWLKEHENGETIGHWENIKTAKNTIKCSKCGHIRELKHFNEIIKRPMFCEMCGVKMKESEETK